jgi:hypothetical protein
MIINGKRALAYITQIDEIKPIPNYDRVEYARIGGWWVIVSKSDNFVSGAKCVYFEVDSKCPENDERFAFLAKRHYKVKTLRMCGVYSQGLIMPISSFPELKGLDVDTDVTDILGIKYAVEEDNKRKNGDPNAKYISMRNRHKKLFKKPWVKWLMKYEWGQKIMFFFFGKKKDNPKKFPTQFPYIKRTDQERIENMTWVLDNKELYYRTQKCDGSSGTYILERKKHNKFEFFVCSRNVRMIKPEQECFYGKDNYYWEVAIKYDIENKLKDYLLKNPELEYVCWQGEICAPGIQKNPHNLSETHFYCFHMIDSKIGKYDITEAKKIWKSYNMEIVPIDDGVYYLNNDLEEFKKTADGFYSPEVCEGNKNCKREGYVYYKVSDPNFSFKNVSREYLISHN